MRAVPWRSAGQRVCLALLFALFAACQAEDEPGAEPNEPTRPTLPPSGLLLSDTTTGPGGETVAWVSIRPGTLAAGATAVVSSPRSRSRLVGFISNGGFDPIAVTAQTGDRVIVEIQDGASVILATFAAVVPSQATPILLRTIPAAGVEDVRPGDTLALVYSEPMDGASVQNAISLALDVVDVPLSAVPGSEGTRYRYAPASPLLEGREYRLQVTAEATDLDDRSPPAATRLSFRTVPDRTPPVLQIVAPVQDADVAREYPCVRATARDASSNLADVQWRFNQGASFPEYMTSMPVNGVNEADVTGCGILGDHAGPNIVTVIARDSAGNTSTATTRLNVPERCLDLHLPVPGPRGWSRWEWFRRDRNRVPGCAGAFGSLRALSGAAGVHCPGPRCRRAPDSHELCDGRGTRGTGHRGNSGPCRPHVARRGRTARHEACRHHHNRRAAAQRHAP